MCGDWIFTTLDLWNANHLIRIKEGDEYRAIFRTDYGRLEYRVMRFGVSHLPATVHADIDDCLRAYIDDFTVCYLDDILDYSTNKMEHEDHLKQVVEWLHQFGLYCNAETRSLVSQRSASLYSSSLLMGSAWNQTAYPPSRTSLLPSQSEMFNCIWDSQTPADDSSANTPWLQHQSPTYWRNCQANGNGPARQSSHFGSYRMHLPMHQSTSISTRRSQ